MCAPMQVCCLILLFPKAISDIDSTHFTGDSRCVLGTGGDTIPLSYDHKPGDELEDARIVAAGGVVNWYRVHFVIYCV